MSLGGNFANQEVAAIDSAYVVVPAEAYTRVGFLRIFSYGALKRGLDLLLASLMLVILSPLFVVVAIAIKLDSKGPVFFRQVRTGKNGREFEMYKFRSMTADNDMNDKSCENKMTRVGAKLRKTSIDELPQLINIVKGEMSFIGPRPWVPAYWKNMNAHERRRGMVRPGITGLAQANGRNGLSIHERINYDLEYVQRYSLKMDITVVLLTIKTVLSKTGAEADKSQMFDDISELKKENRRVRPATSISLQEMATKVL